MSKRTELLQVRLTKGEAKDLKRDARREGRSVAEHVRINVLPVEGVTRGERGSAVPKIGRRA